MLIRKCVPVHGCKHPSKHDQCDSQALHNIMCVVDGCVCVMCVVVWWLVECGVCGCVVGVYWWGVWMLYVCGCVVVVYVLWVCMCGGCDGCAGVMGGQV